MLSAIEAARREAERLRRIIRKGSNRQVQAGDEKALARATALAWFNNHRVALASLLEETDLAQVDEDYKALLAAAARSTSRTKYNDILKRIRNRLGQLETIAVRPATASIPGARSSDAPPDFTPLVPDARMQGILVRRWRECSTCVNSGAALAAIVMMGGLLEGLLLARIHRETDRHRLVTASTAPKDRSTGKAVPLTVWTLKDYINVPHELSWISQSVRDISVVLRDYRNYIHPQKEYSHGIPIEPGDAYVLWEVAKSIARQLIAGTKRTARA